MAEAVLQHAAVLKEAQIMSNEMEESVMFQFTVVDAGHSICSSYDMVLNGLTGEGDDPALHETPKPCIGVRVVDYKHEVAYLWSLEKLHERVRNMRQLHQCLDQPELPRNPTLENPFVESCMPQFTLVGEVDVPLKAVLECRVQDFTLDVLSPHTSHVIGIIRLSLEPSHARAPTNTIKFNVVMREMVGFAEREGTDVHAQLFIPRISEEDGITTTQMIKDFDEGPIRFESVHSMSMPLFAPEHATLRVAIFAKVFAMHLDKLSSWDDMRDGVQDQSRAARVAESQFFTQEKHDLLARIQILEMNENGEYVPVDVTQVGAMDPGTFQLHQGLQRRIAINVTHSSGDTLSWDDVSSLRVAKVQLVDQAGRVSTKDHGSQPLDISLRLPTKPIFRNNANGTRSITIFGQWDSSLHDTILLDRTTADKNRVQMTIAWEITSSKLAEPMKFSSNVFCKILSRSHVRQTSMLSALWQTSKIVHSSPSIFTLTMRPAPIKRVGDLWRMDSQHDYIKGEEHLTSWTPRGVSLVLDHVAARKKKRKATEMASIQALLRKIKLPEPEEKSEDSELDDLPSEPPITKFDDDDLLHDTPESSQADESNEAAVNGEANGENAETNGANGESPDPDAAGSEEDNGEAANPEESLYTVSEKELLAKCVKLWQKYPDPLLRILSSENTAPPADGLAPESAAPPSLITTVIGVSRNPKMLKNGYLLVPNSDSTRWVKRFVELRKPYLHIYSATDGEEASIVSLRNSRVDSQPGILALLQGGTVHDGEMEHGANGTTDFVPGHRRTSSGRVISTIWTGTGGGGGGQGLHRLSERLQSAVFAVYGTDNTWLFAARSERDKMDWILRIDQSFVSNGGSNASGSASPAPAYAGGYPGSDTGSGM